MSNHQHDGSKSTLFVIPVLESLPSAEDFYNQYVAKRQPVVIRKGASSLTNDKDNNATIPTLDSWKSLVPSNAAVQVNHRSNISSDASESSPASFSPQHSVQKHTTWGDFMNSFESSLDYMTTQTLPLDDEGRPHLHTTPVTQLFASSSYKIPMRPLLLGNLIPMTWNVWMGHSRSSSSSSGWHHDYHDNLYCLWQGRKEFTIAPPCCLATGALQTEGTLEIVYPNGRIVYKEQLGSSGTSAKIRPDGALDCVDRIYELEQERDLLVEKLDALQEQNLEARLQEIEEDLLNFECDGRGSDEEQESSEDDDDDTEEPDEPSTKRARTDGSKSPLPLNFVTKMQQDHDVNTVSLNRGDIFYLPAGWFHNVHSSGGVHVAFNYWMHPPDTGTTFEQPYLSEFWERQYESSTK